MLLLWKAFFSCCGLGTECAGVNQKELCEYQFWSHSWVLAPLRNVKTFAAQGHWQLLFRYWRLLRCRKIQPQCVSLQKNLHFWAWLCLFQHLELSFWIPHNYYFCFPFKNPLSKLIWLKIVSNLLNWPFGNKLCLWFGLCPIWIYISAATDFYWEIGSFLSLHQVKCALGFISLFAASFWARSFKERAWLAGVVVYRCLGGMDVLGFCSWWAVWWDRHWLAGWVWVAAYESDSVWNHWLVNPTKKSTRKKQHCAAGRLRQLPGIKQ